MDDIIVELARRWLIFPREDGQPISCAIVAVGAMGASVLHPALILICYLSPRQMQTKPVQSRGIYFIYALGYGA